ncbi:transcriptional regulator [Bradyrhizobium sp. CCBAU 051011]|nr:transcriptional regulator [Bradyrhizobium sp. CCBAU 051011]
MGQQLQGWRSASSQRLWLSMLIDAMEETSRPERRAEPCDGELLAALRAQLARPALLRTPYTSAYSLRN